MVMNKGAGLNESSLRIWAGFLEKEKYFLN